MMALRRRSIPSPVFAETWMALARRRRLGSRSRLVENADQRDAFGAVGGVGFVRGNVGGFHVQDEIGGGEGMVAGGVHLLGEGRVIVFDAGDVEEADVADG